MLPVRRRRALDMLFLRLGCEAMNLSAERRPTMPYVNVGKEYSSDIQMYYKDWGSGQPVVFSHGWPLSADAWEDQMFYLASRGYRCIAHDRRGHGRSTQTWGGNDLDTYADDLAKLCEALDLKNAIHVGH